MEKGLLSKWVLCHSNPFLLSLTHCRIDCYNGTIIDTILYICIINVLDMYIKFLTNSAFRIFLKYTNITNNNYEIIIFSLNTFVS